eukprot:jgi/Psemu1/287455/fgenesh1_pg.192_\
MNLFKSSRKAEKDEPVRAIIGDLDEESNYPYEDEAKVAAEMESILGNALTMTERNNGSIIRLQRSSTFEEGRRIASSLGSAEEFSASGSHLDHSDGYSYVSRDSSFQSAASMPTFVKVDPGEHSIWNQKSWDEIMGSEAENKVVPSGREPENPASSEWMEPTRGRSWSKLRREIDFEEQRMEPAASLENDPNDLSRSMSLGKMAFNFRKKPSKDTHSTSNKAEKQSTKNILSKIQKYRSEGKNPLGRFGTGSNGKNSNDMRTGRTYAKDYDVEVSLQERKSFWKQLSNRGEDTKHSGWITKSKSRSEKNTEPKKESDASWNNSFDTPATTNITEDLPPSPNDARREMEEQNSTVFVLPATDILLESLEVVCCHRGDNSKTLDAITDSVPPYM